MEKLPPEADSVNAMSFIDIVSGQEKHDVARTFSALLQLVIPFLVEQFLQSFASFSLKRRS